MNQKITLLLATVLGAITFWVNQSQSEIQQISSLAKSDFDLPPIVDGVMDIQQYSVSLSNEQFADMMQEVLAASQETTITSLILYFEKNDYSFTGTYLSNIDAGLKFIGQISSLESLKFDFTNNQIETIDFNEITGLQNLNNIFIYLGYNKISNDMVQNMGPLKELANLDHFLLDVYGNTVTSLNGIEFLGELSNLKSLHLIFTFNDNLADASELECVQNLTNLENLVLKFNWTSLENIKFVNGYDALTSLRHIYIDTDQAEVVSLQPLNFLFYLTTLETMNFVFNDNKINEEFIFSPGTQVNLTSFILDLGTIYGGNNIQNFDNLNDLRNSVKLETLNLNFYDIGVKSVEFLNYFGQLTELKRFDFRAEENQIVRVNFDLLQNSTKLESFDASINGNKLKTVEFEFGQLTQLQNFTLSMGTNQIVNTPEFGNGVKNLESLERFVIKASENKISSVDFIEEFSGLTNLKELTFIFSDNIIQSIEQLDVLSEIKAPLDHLYFNFKENPITALNQCQGLQNTLSSSLTNTDVNVDC